MVCVVCEDDIPESIINDDNKIGKCTLCNGHFHHDCGKINQEICNKCQAKILDDMFKKEDNHE
jgi:hypothetical protein